VIQLLAWAESLGLVLVCSQECNTAISVWDFEKRIWLDEDDEPVVFVPQCAECGAHHALPPKEHVEAWVVENQPL
jgi:hypothetical protein